MGMEESQETHHLDADMVEALLQAGADPNERANCDPTHTVWSRSLEQILQMCPIYIRNEPQLTNIRQAQLI